jgi:hypothetical protein
MIVDLIFWFFLCCIVFLFLSFPVAIVLNLLFAKRALRLMKVGADRLEKEVTK